MFKALLKNRINSRYVEVYFQSVNRKGTIADFYGSSTAWKGESHFRNKYLRKNAEKFEGYVPTDELQFNYCRSSGAGGQHVNKTNTKVEARFHVESAEWIPEEVRQKLLVAEQSRINKDGFLIVTSEKTRVQALNQADVLEKLRKMLFEASQDPRQTTQKDIQILKEREDRSKEANIRFKRERAAKRKYNIRPSDFHL